MWGHYDVSNVTQWRKWRLCLCALLLIGWATACHIQPQSQIYTGRGVIQHIAPDGASIRIAHQDIPGFMQAMTMDFELKDPTVLTGAKVGDEVEFTLEKTSDRLDVIALHVIVSARPTVQEEEEPPVPDESVADDSTPPAEADAEAAFSPYPASDFTLTDQDGQPLTLSSLRGKIVLLDFIFTRCPGPCPLLSLKFAQLQKKLGERLGKDVMLLSVTIDPRHDTPDVLKDYAKRYEAHLNGWKFLTGSTRDIIMTAAAFGADYQSGMEGIVDHRLLTCVIDRDGAVVKEFTGTNHTVEDLLAEIDRLRL